MNEVVFITGGSRGIGAAIAKRFARAGDAVAITYRDDAAGAESVCADIRSSGDRVLAIRADARADADVVRAGAATERELGPVTVLIHNASAPIAPAPVLDAGWESYEEHLATTLRGAWNSVHAIAPGMVARRRGSIVMVVTKGALETPPAGWSAYLTAKHALIGYAKSLAAELGPKGIRVNMASPGLVETELTAELPDVYKRLAASRSPGGRLATVDEVAEAVYALATDEAANGTHRVIDGS